MLIHSFIAASRVNGPGLRAVVYFQGCNLGCHSCWNPETHAFTGNETSVSELTDLVLRAHHEQSLEGVTFSGGEPMQQADCLLAVIQSLSKQAPELSLALYSGYSARELEQGRYWCRSALTQPEKQATWQGIRFHLDFAVLGRYVGQRPSTLPLQTSANQRLVLFSSRYAEPDFAPQEVEIGIGANGLVQLTGFPISGVPI
jgi:anaerobic ribonucleoside-triphosphate reductase activating protein